MQSTKPIAKADFHDAISTAISDTSIADQHGAGLDVGQRAEIFDTIDTEFTKRGYVVTTGKPGRFGLADLIIGALLVGAVLYALFMAITTANASEPAAARLGAPISVTATVTPQTSPPEPVATETPVPALANPPRVAPPSDPAGQHGTSAPGVSEPTPVAHEGDLGPVYPCGHPKADEEFCNQTPASDWLEDRLDANPTPTPVPYEGDLEPVLPCRTFLNGYPVGDCQLPTLGEGE